MLAGFEAPSRGQILLDGIPVRQPGADRGVLLHQSSLAGFIRKAGRNTLREAIIDYSSMGACIDLVGSPETIAAQMDEAMQEVGGDGFLIARPNVSRKSVAEVTEGLVPALQQRGLMRRAFEHTHFRDNLLAFST